MQFGPYQLVRRIGAGGMGEVWLARQFLPSGVSRAVALKRLPRRLARKERYRRILMGEARLAMMLRHSNIIDVFDAGELEGEAYIAMEFVDGEDLSRVLKRMRALNQGELDPRLIAYIIAEILRALCYAHEFVDDQGRSACIVHRDISPHNIMLATSGAVKLADFGVARLASEETSGTHVKGKIRYMPPEQLRGESKSPSVDLFAVGAVLQELLDAEVFRGEDIEDATLLGIVMDGIIPQPAQPVRTPPAIEALRRALLEPNPNRRIRTAREALDKLYEWPAFRNAETAVADLVKRARAAPTNWEPEPAEDIDGYDSYDRPLSDTLDPVGDTGIGFGVAETLLHDDDGRPYRSGSFEDLAVIDPLASLDPLGEPRVDSSVMAQLEGLSDEPQDSAGSFNAGLPPSKPPVRLKNSGPSWGSVGSRKHTKSGPAPVTGHPEFDLGPSIAVSPGLARPSTGSHAPVTGSHPSARPRRRWGRAVLGVLALAALGVGGTFAADHLGLLDGEINVGPKLEPERRRARILHDGRPAHVAFELLDAEVLETSGIAYDFAPNSGLDHPLDALANGQAEFVLTTLDAVLRAQPKGKIVAVTNVSTGAEGLVLDSPEFPKLRALAELPREGTLAVARSGSAASLGLTLRAYLDALSPLTVDSGYADSAEAWAALSAQGNGVVAAVLSEPELGRARAAGMRVAVTSRAFPRAAIDVLVASDAVLEADPQLVQAVVDAYFEGALNALAEQTPSQVLAERRELEPGEAAPLAAGLCFVGSNGASILPSALAQTWAALAMSDGEEPAQAPALGGLSHALKLGGDPETTPSLPAIVAACLDRPPPSPRELGALGELRLPPGTWFEAKADTLAPAAPMAPLIALLEPLIAAGFEIELTGLGDGASGGAKKLGKRRADTLAKAMGIYGVQTKGAGAGAEGVQLRVSVRAP